MRSMTESSGVMSCAESSTVVWSSRDTRRSKATIPATLNYHKFTSQEELGHFLEKQYKIRTPRELTSCEVCHR